MFFLAVITFMMTMLYTIEVARGLRRLRNLNDIRPFSGPSRPRVSIIVPACNEEETIETAMLSLVNQDYGSFEIVVINDRSTDRTGSILEELASRYPRIRLLEVTELPAGWLGKNHALHCGARAASGDYLLFTDADVLFEKTTVARAMTIMVAERLDHLSLIFRNIAAGSLLNAMIQDAGAALFFLFKPWAVRNPRSGYFMGVGAFNLVKKDVYRRIGGHESIRMHPIDDIMLGKVIKQHGFRQDCLAGYDFVTVRWYETAGMMIDGLMKNVFALYNFRVTWVLAGIVLIFVMAIFPVWGIFLADGYARLLFLATVMVRGIAFVRGSIMLGNGIRSLPWSLVTPYINIFIMIKATVTTLKNKGIDWRGTHYPLEQLRDNMPILQPFAARK